MWATVGHLVFGNAIIGGVEGVILSRLFKCPRQRAIPILIAANYASAWAGGYLVTGVLPTLPDLTIENLRLWFAIFVATAFVITLLIELPFFWFALRPRENPLRRSLVATPLIHGISYTLLLGCYWMMSGTSMMTRLEVVPVNELKLSKPYSLYFITSDGEQVARINLEEPYSQEVVSPISAHNRNDRLFVRHGNDSDFDLFARVDSGNRGPEKEVLIEDSFSDRATVDWRMSEKRQEKPEGTWFNFGPVPSIPTDSNWAFQTGFWPVEGIRGKNESSGDRFRYSLETPFAAWPVRNAIQLAGDYVVFQLGRDQICLFHPETKKLALVARGKGPVVAGRSPRTRPPRKPRGVPHLTKNAPEEFEPAASMPNKESMKLHPDYPVVEGQYQMTKDWTVELPSKFNRRIEDGDLVLWKPGFTIWATAWNNDKSESQEERLDWIRSDSSTKAFDVSSDSEEGIVRYSYRLEEEEDERQPAFYGFAIGTQGHIQMAIYFDSADAIDEASAIFRSLKEAPAKN